MPPFWVRAKHGRRYSLGDRPKFCRPCFAPTMHPPNPDMRPSRPCTNPRIGVLAIAPHATPTQNRWSLQTAGACKPLELANRWSLQLRRIQLSLLSYWRPLVTYPLISPNLLCLHPSPCLVAAAVVRSSFKPNWFMRRLSTAIAEPARKSQDQPLLPI